MNKYTREIMTHIKENFEKVIGIREFQNTSEARSFYLADLADNLYEPMGDAVLKAYGQGSGNEIASGKMNALRSSSALTYNLFGNNPAIISGKKYSVEFEKQYHTLKHTVPGKPANLDAFLYCEETQEAIACEMKMMEWIFNKPSKLRSKYLDTDSYISKDVADVFISIAKTLISDEDSCAEGLEEYSCKLKKHDAFQMFKHTLACYSACNGEEPRKIEKLTLVNCVWTLPIPDKLSGDHCKTYKDEEDAEHTEFEIFRKLMKPVQKLFKDNIGVTFDIKFYTFNNFLSLLSKAEDELNYLKRYTFN